MLPVNLFFLSISFNHNIFNMKTIIDSNQLTFQLSTFLPKTPFMKQKNIDQS